MTREEEIKKAAGVFYASSDDYTAYKKGYEEGAKWADEHPRNGLWNSEKVIEWLEKHFEHYAYNYGIAEVISNLTKAMEEE